MVDLTLPDASPAEDSGDAARRLVARVQAWQHRHPLARRLPAADVGGLGVIALPFDKAAAGGQPQPLFHQPSLLPGLSHRALVEFAVRHAVTFRPGPADWPLREVERSDASSDPAPETRYLLTAAITEPVRPGAQPRRLLIAPEGPAIWGPRPLSRRRLAAAVGALLVIMLVIMLAIGSGLRGRRTGAEGPTGAVPPAAAGSASAPSAMASAIASPVAAPAASSPPAGAASIARPAPAATRASTVPSAALASAAASGPGSARAASAASAVSAALRAPAGAAPPSTPSASAPGPVTAPAKPPSGPASAVAGPASAALPPPPKLLPMPALRAAAASPAASAPAPDASAAMPAGTRFALVSVPSKKRAEAQETLVRVHKVLGPAIGNLQAQIMPTPEGFVVTIWPLPTQADAERLAEVLARRGVPMKWLEF